MDRTGLPGSVVTGRGRVRGQPARHRRLAVVKTTVRQMDDGGSSRTRSKQEHEDDKSSPDR